MDKTEKMGWATVDQPGVPWLAKKQDLHIDSNYQRTMVSESRIAAITQQWSWVACGSIIIAERDGTFWVIDGQHRVLAAMRRSDIQELPCIVFKSLGVEDEALAFYRANSVRGNVTPFDKLRALLAAGDRLAIDVVTIMDEQGYKPSNVHGGAYTVSCVAAFVSAVKVNRGALKKVWPLVAKLHNGLQIKKSVLDALIYIAKFGTDDITSPQWEKRVLKRGLHEINNAIDRAHSLYQRGGTKIFAAATVEVLNKGLPQSARMGLDETAPDEDA
jgi:hypothetical protein